MIVTALVMQAALMSPAACSDQVEQAQNCRTTQVVGHRCRSYSAKKNNENTVAALKAVAKRGVRWCEIDVWQLADGKTVVWHDPTWTRVADPATIPANMPVELQDSTWAQARQIRTRGGARVATLGRMIRVAGKNDVHLMVEVKNNVADPDHWLDLAAAKQVKTLWYQEPNYFSCESNRIAPIAAAGGVTGVKQYPGGHCAMTPQEVAGLGSFVAENAGAITRQLTSDYADAGVKVYAKLAPRRSWARLVDAGAHIITKRPVAALRWTKR